MSALAREFRALRAQKGHFSGEEWNDTVDRFGGRKHVVMQALGDALGDGTHTRAEIVQLLGAPDAVLAPGDMMFREAYDGADARVRELLVYQWRGGHDFLYFGSDGVRVYAHGWWAALE
jgi:predicted PolB exonuclease-like 3'-5' exonuclease